MVEILNFFLTIFAGITQGFTDLSFSGYNLGSLIFGGFVLSVVFVFILRVIRR